MKELILLQVIRSSSYKFAGCQQHQKLVDNLGIIMIFARSAQYIKTKFLMELFMIILFNKVLIKNIKINKFCGVQNLIS